MTRQTHHFLRNPVSGGRGRGRGRRISEFKTSLVYRESSMTAKATQRNPIFKKKKKKKKREREPQHYLLYVHVSEYTHMYYIHAGVRGGWKSHQIP
jgi:hypothetical protein